jgi:hypothetical protein
MVVGADRRGRCCGGVWRDAEPSPLLTALVVRLLALLGLLALIVRTTRRR